MEYIKIKDILSFQKKSKIKASEGLKIGKYNFYTSSKEQNKFLDYYEYSNEEVLSKELEYCLIFISALGILNYTKRVEDKEFEELGLKMLSDVENYFEQIWGWPIKVSNLGKRLHEYS